MEYEIYYLCNILGFFLVIAIILFHFVEADKKEKVKQKPEKIEHEKLK